MSDNFEKPELIASRAIAIYDSRYRDEYEPKYSGKFVAINIKDDSATLGDSGSEALIRAKQENPDGIFHLIRVGHPAAFEVGMAYRYATPNRLRR